MSEVPLLYLLVEISGNVREPVEVAQHLRQDRSPWAERESYFIDNLLVRIHLIIVMISVDRPFAMGV